MREQEIAHGVKVNEEGVFVDKMPHAVEKMMIENLVDGYSPKRVEAKIPILSFFALKKRRLSNAYTEEQKTAFDQFWKEISEPFGMSLISEFQSRFPHAEIVEIPNGHHYCFIAQEELVYNKMRNFLRA